MTAHIRYVVRPVDGPGPDPLTGPHFGIHPSDGDWSGGAVAWAVRARDAQLIAVALTAHRTQLSHDAPAMAIAVNRAREAMDGGPRGDDDAH